MPTRTRPVALGGLLLAGLIALVASGQPWWRAVGEGVNVSFTGNDSTGRLSQALALLLPAGMLLLLVLRGRGRRVGAVLLAGAAIGVAAVGVTAHRPTAEAVHAQVRTVSLSDQFALVGTPWPWVYAVAGLLGLTAAAYAFVTAPRWPTTPGRYDRARAAQDPWQALDAGIDPTEQPVGDTPGADTPDVHNR